MITIRYHCSRREYKAGKALLVPPERIAARRKAKPSLGRSFGGWILFVGLSIFFFLILRSNRTYALRGPAPATSWSALAISGAALSFGGLVALLLGIRLVSIASWQAVRWKATGLTLRFSEEGVEHLTADGRVLQRWPYFTGMAENVLAYGLRWHGGEGLIVPKSMFTTEELLVVDQMLKEKLATRVPTLAAGFEVTRV